MKQWIACLAGLLIFVALVHPAAAVEAVRENFEGPGALSAQEVAEGRTPGSRALTRPETDFKLPGGDVQERPIALGSGEKGAISFDLQRRPGVPADERRTVFSLVGQGERAPFFVQVQWSAEASPGRPMLLLRGKRFWTAGLGLWSPRILLDREVGEGEWIHVDLTWDDRLPSYQVFVDGLPQDTETYYAESGEQVPDPRLVQNREHEEVGLPPNFTSRPFGGLVSDVDAVQLGAHRRRNEAGEVYTPLSNAVLDNFVITVDQVPELVTKVHEQGYDVQSLAGEYTPGGTRLTWDPPEVRGVNQGYLVYRRSGATGDTHFEKLGPQRVYDLTFTDTTAFSGENYRYSVTALFGDGRGGDVESKYPPEITVVGSDLYVAGVTAEQPLYGTGQEIVVTLRGTADLPARFTIDGVAADVAMEEVDDGVYVGSVPVPEGMNVTDATLTATLGGLTVTGSPITIDTTPPEAIATGRILEPAVAPGEIELSWAASTSADVARYGIYRGEGAAPSVGGTPLAETRELSFIDSAVLGGLEYFYTVVAIDAAGNPSAPSDVVSATAEADDGPLVSAITVEPFGRPLKPGETVTLSVTGQSGAVASVDLSTLAAALPLTEAGSSGTYSATYTVVQDAVAPTKSLHRVVVTLTDDYGTTTQAGPELAVIGEDALNDTEAPVISGASHDGWQVAGFSGKLVAGDVLTVTLEGEANGYASFAVDGVTDGVTMDETPAGSGVYVGLYTVGWDDQGTDVAVTATLADEAGNATTTAVGRTLNLDTRVRLGVTARDELLPADSESQTRLVVKAEDANGDAVSGHELSLTLSTTEDYTGVVGGGDVEGIQASKDDAEDLEVKWGGTTDFGGEVAATYTAGFAAKTALIIAKDLTTGDVGAGWLNTYVASTVSIQLTPVAARAARGIEDRAVLTLTADPAKLTADGRSKSRLTATLKDFSGTPIAGERISFSLARDNGRLRVLRGVTDGNGVAEAEYRAGTMIGTVTVSAASTDYGVTASVQITLMSDAPAKIDLVASAVSLPADGRSTADIALRVTDINDNPNAEVPVALAILEGGGELSAADLLTDRNGEGGATYTAGRNASTTVIEARHTSRAPTEGELRRIYGTVFVPKLMDRQERERIKVTEWLVDAGDEVTKGDPLVTIESRKASWTLTAPETGTFVREVKHRRDRVELGDTLGYVEIDPEVWEGDYVR